MGCKTSDFLCTSGFLPKMHSSQTQWAITPSGCRSGSISGVQSHTRVSSTFLAALFYLPCITVAKQSRHLQSALCADLDILPARLETKFLELVPCSTSLSAFLLAQDHAQSTLPIPWNRTAVVLQGEGNSISSFLIPAKDWDDKGLTQWDTALAPVATPTLFQCQWSAMGQLSTTFPLQCIFQMSPRLPKWHPKII